MANRSRINIGKLFSVIGVLISIPIIAALVIIVSPFIIIGVLIDLYERLWRKLRHDPIIDLTVADFSTTRQITRLSRDEWIESFDRISDFVTTAGMATQGELKMEGFDIFDQKPPIEFSTATLRQRLRSSHAEIELTLGLDVRSEEDRIYAYGSDDDAGLHIPVRVIKPWLEKTYYIDLDSREGVWTTVSLLRGDVRFSATRKGPQLWAYVKEFDVWLAKYQGDDAGYGIRSDFRGQVARRWFFDKQPNKSVESSSELYQS